MHLGPVEDAPPPFPSWQRDRVSTIASSGQPSGARPVARVQLVCPDPWCGPVARALAAAGVVVDRQAPVGVAVTAGRAVPSTVDGWTVDSLPHLLVAVRPWAVEVGPWVAPGVGPCARCVSAGVLDEGLPAAPEDLAASHLLAMAGGWVGREVLEWRAGRVPATWLTSWRLDHDPVPGQRRWERHPYCGCSWFDAAVVEPA